MFCILYLCDDLLRYALEFLFLSVAKLTMLFRMSTFLASDGPSKRRVKLAGDFFLAIVVAINIVGVIGNSVAAVYFLQAAALFKAASAGYAAGNDADGERNSLLGKDEIQRALSVVSVQSYCEVIALLLIVVAFAAVGIACARRIRSAFSGLDSNEPAVIAGKQLQLQIVSSTGVVFLTFLIRSVYSTLYAAALNNQDYSNKCPGNTIGFCNAECYNAYTHIVFFILFKPEFTLSIVLISKPLPLLVVLWGNTTGRMRLRREEQSGNSGLELPSSQGRQPLMEKLAFWRRIRESWKSAS